MNLLLVIILLLPLLSGILIGCGAITGALCKPGQERSVTRCTELLLFLLCAACAVLVWAAPWASTTINLGTWMQAGELHLELLLYSGGLHAWLGLLFSLLLFVTFRFTSTYLHREPGFFRFYAVMCFFTFAMLLLVFAATAVLTFVAWEIAGVSSWLLIAYNFRRDQVVRNASRVFIVQRIGDALFLVGIALMLLWTGTDQWQQLAASTALSALQLTLIACTFIGAAAIKSAQFPFTTWLYRAMEGPTPSSAVFYGGVMLHAGVYLLILLQDLISESGFARLLLLLTGLATVGYAAVVGKSQADIKSSMASAGAVQLGLMFATCGLGWWDLALWHLAAHAILRTYVFLRTPSILHNAHSLPLPAVTAPSRWLQLASLQQFWLDEAQDKVITNPLTTLAADVSYFENHVLDPLMGIPAPMISRVSTMAQQREHLIGARLDSDSDSFALGSGLASRLTAIIAGLSHWFEERFILQGVGRDMISLGRQLGHIANRFEQLLLRPRYLVLFVLVTVLVVL